MPIVQTVSEQMSDAMRARDRARLTALRNLKAAFGNELIALKRSTNDALTDDEALAVIRRLARQRRDSIEQFRKGGREELAKAEEQELAVLEAFLPQMMNEGEMHAVVLAQKAKLGVTDKTRLGMLVGAVMKETKGRADGAAVKRIAESLFA